MQFDQSNMVELENSISSTHKLYGTPKFKKEDENDEWSPTSLRFIVMSPDLTALPSDTRKLGKVYYSRGDYWGNPVFANCQTASSDSDGCNYIDEHSAGYDGNFLPIDISSVWFNESEMTLTEGDEGWLYANIDPWDATDQNLVWKSSDEKVATIYTEDGRNATIKALGSGETSITATSSNGISATCIVKV
ncbi:MAG: Ig-like domain-containing protein, partial [Muribaculaceae bacterium]|nr:Ig-like domain-containing protein [Muribaculaceae bacterium]